MNDIELKAYKKVLFCTMKAFIGVCEKYDINYFACSGTAIGAVRHHGCIPWDDDIDVLMLRKDYEKLMSIRNELQGSGYEIINHKDKDYPLPYAKFCDANTTLWERKEYHFIEGVFIDLFPLDEAPNNIKEATILEQKYKRLFRKYEYSTARYSIIDIFNAIKHKDTRLTGHIILCWFKYRWFKKRYYKNFIAFEEQIKQLKGERLLCYFCSYPVKKELFRKEWFDGYQELPYEDFTIRVPNNYHDYLTQLFGNFMQLPPIENRKSYHKHYFLDLSKRINI